MSDKTKTSKNELTQQAYLHGKKVSTKRAKKKGLKSGNTKTSIALCSTRVIKSPKHRKKRIVTIRSRQTRPSCTSNHLQKMKMQNVIILTIKCMKQCIKPMQKIRQAPKYIYNANKQKGRQVNKQTIAQDGCHNMPKMQKRNSKKTFHHLFGDCNVNKYSINTGQKQKSNEKHLSKGKANISANNAQKIAQFAYVTPKQT